jgi:hypothetical protein
MAESLLARMTQAGGADSAIAVEHVAFDRTPFFVIAQPKSLKTWAKLVLAKPTVQEGEIFYIPPDPEAPVELPNFKFNLIAAKQFFTQENAAGNILKVWMGSKPPDIRKWREYVECVVLGHVNDQIICGRMTFKTTKCPAVHGTIDKINLAKTPEWADQGEAAKATLKIQDPRFRVTTIITLTTKTGQESGINYMQADANVSPTDMSTYDKLVSYFGDEASLPLFDAVQKAFDERIADMTKMNCAPASDA